MSPSVVTPVGRHTCKMCGANGTLLPVKTSLNCTGCCRLCAGKHGLRICGKGKTESALEENTLDQTLQDDSSRRNFHESHDLLDRLHFQNRPPSGSNHCIGRILLYHTSHGSHQRIL